MYVCQYVLIERYILILYQRRFAIIYLNINLNHHPILFGWLRVRSEPKKVVSTVSLQITCLLVQSTLNFSHFSL